MFGKKIETRETKCMPRAQVQAKCNEKRGNEKVQDKNKERELSSDDYRESWQPSSGWTWWHTHAFSGRRVAQPWQSRIPYLPPPVVARSGDEETGVHYKRSETKPYIWRFPFADQTAGIENVNDKSIVGISQEQNYKINWKGAKLHIVKGGPRGHYSLCMRTLKLRFLHGC